MMHCMRVLALPDDLQGAVAVAEAGASAEVACSSHTLGFQGTTISTQALVSPAQDLESDLSPGPGAAVLPATQIPMRVSQEEGQVLWSLGPAWIGGIL